MAIPSNRQAVIAILSEISGRIIGQEKESISCYCGSVHCDRATAVAIYPGGDAYPGQETHVSCWSVAMRYYPNDPMNRCGYDARLSDFISILELYQIFNRHFGQTVHSFNSPWCLVDSGLDRVINKLPSVVRIRNNQKLMEFTFDWGSCQRTARSFAIKRFSAKIDKNVDPLCFGSILTKLDKVKADVYLGGPAPEYEFESEWLEKFSMALEVAKNSEQVTVKSRFVYFKTDNYVTGTSLVFLKHKNNY